MIYPFLWLLFCLLLPWGWSELSSKDFKTWRFPNVSYLPLLDIELVRKVWKILGRLGGGEGLPQLWLAPQPKPFKPFKFPISHQNLPILKGLGHWNLPNLPKPSNIVRFGRLRFSHGMDILCFLSRLWSLLLLFMLWCFGSQVVDLPNVF